MQTNIHTLLKKYSRRWFRGHNKEELEKGSGLLLLFALFFLITLTYFATTEAFFKEGSNESENRETDDLFISYEEGMMDSVQDMIFTDDNFIFAGSPPCFVDAQVLGVRGVEERRSIISYRAKEGDTLASIADEFGVSGDTIRWANSIENGKVKKGDELLILPVSGVMYYVERNDTPGEIAQKHKASLEDIIAFNNIESVTEIRPGDQLIIPGGEKPPTPPPSAPAPRRSPTSVATGFVSVTRGVVTQTAHAGHRNAVDIANNCGTPIYAASSGTVTRTGTDPRAGRFIWINHGNLEAMYAHLRSIHVSPGQSVSAGQQIGTMGNTGFTIGATGCHIHFETRGGLNPFRNMGRGQTM